MLSKIGEYFLKLCSLVGTIVIEIVNLPNKIKRINIRELGREFKKFQNKWEMNKNKDEGEIIVKDIKIMDIKEKEKTVFKLQILSITFVLLSILYIFNYLSLPLYLFLGIATICLIYYILKYQIRVMYPQDYEVYRNFFLSYVGIGIFLVMIADNPLFVLYAPFQYFPSITLILFSIFLVLLMYYVFRIKYYRNYTYGEVVEVGKNTVHVKVDYDIRANVLPDIYIVEKGNFDVKEGEIVKLKVEGGRLSVKGNKPTKIIGKI
ncbi:Protein of unknown function DUF2101, membrane [Methanothermus fervidus DSM 2088]|uniref:Uncharacterized protein n=1 Tax=Methanothermus fervidus (strain ATCC 43054 / DSM 2088 / JCM 10308 / V24 S) TaxID=523846 RepID=E3GYT2_METFV|nr:DUF2101 family protein [Methanothermus fervidus]ADP77464.1 Protein of unknown function DUF2101, membrane [Methanothermus fervidus DSM 2088]